MCSSLSQFFNRFYRHLTMTALVFLAAILIAPSALACHTLDRNGNPKPHGKEKNCGPDTSPPPESVNTGAYFLGNYGHFKETGPRDYIPQGLTFDSGDYVTTDLVSPVAVNTRNMSPQAIKGKVALCRTLENREGTAYYLIPESYSYGWVDDCRDGECGIEVRISFGGNGGISENDILNITGGQSNQLDFVMYSSFTGATGIANPFVTERIFDIVKTTVDFKKPGTTRSIGVCDYFAGGWGEPEFRSIPKQP